MAGTDVCPNCGAEFPAGRLACPECGSDAETGWRDAEEIEDRSTEIPDAWPPDDGSPTPGRRAFPWFVAAALALLAAVVLALIW